MSTPAPLSIAWTRVWSRALLAACAIVGSWTVAVWLAGGIDASIGGLRLRSREPLRPALIAAGLALLYALVSWRSRAAARGRAAVAPGYPVVDDVSWFARSGARHAAAIAALLAAIVGLAAWLTTSLVAGGADAYGYVSQAYLWLRGDLVVPEPLIRQAPWPYADLSYTPLGYRPALEGDALVPTYAPGLPLLMAIGVLIAGDCGPFLVVPIFGALAIWLTARLGRALSGPWIGLGAALLLAASPTVAYMLMWPMSDVPVMACWLAATVSALSRGRAPELRTGLLASLAIAIRPNLAVLVLPFVWWVLRAPDARDGRWRRLAWLLGGVLPGVVLVAIVHTRLYGAPWRSGYGSVDQLYAWSHLARNLARYPRWLIETETVFVLGALAPIGAALGRAAARRLEEPHARVMLLALVIAGVWASYLFYAPFDDWWYLRFLLPALPQTLVLAVYGWSALARWRWPLGTIVAAVATIAAAAHGCHRIVQERMDEVGRGELAYVRVAQFVADELPANAVLLAMQHSGTLRYYAGRPTLRYDWLTREWWPRALDALVEQGLQPFFVLNQFEEAIVRARLARAPGAEVLGCLVAIEARAEGARIYDPLRRRCAPLRIEPAVAHPCRRPAPMAARIPRHAASEPRQ